MYFFVPNKVKNTILVDTDMKNSWKIVRSHLLYFWPCLEHKNTIKCYTQNNITWNIGQHLLYFLVTIYQKITINIQLQKNAFLVFLKNWRHTSIVFLKFVRTQKYNRCRLSMAQWLVFRPWTCIVFFSSKQLKNTINYEIHLIDKIDKFRVYIYCSRRKIQ